MEKADDGIFGQIQRQKMTISAPGKLMIMGEHAVVYNHPCIVTSVGQRMRVTVEKVDKSVFYLDAPDVNVTSYTKPISKLGKGDMPKGAKFVEVATLNFFKKFKIKGGIKVKTSSQFSSQFGFGSSSASTVCMIKALSEIFGKKLGSKQIFDLAYKTVLDIQGKGSGFDVAAATYGGTLYFLTGGKIIKPLKVEKLSIVVGYSGIKVDTVTIVDEVAERAKKYPKIINDTYNQIELLVNQAKKAILNSDFETLGELLNFNQGYLETLGVGSRKLSDMIYAARDAGAYGAKLSGAGVGDCMFALVNNKNRKAVEGAIERASGQVIEVKLNVEGVRVE